MAGRMKLYDKLVAKGFPPEFATNMTAMMVPYLSILNKEDRAMIESYIPIVAETVEEAWLGGALVGPRKAPSYTMGPQTETPNRE